MVSFKLATLLSLISFATLSTALRPAVTAEKLASFAVANSFFIISFDGHVLSIGVGNNVDFSPSDLLPQPGRDRAAGQYCSVHFVPYNTSYPVSIASGFLHHLDSPATLLLSKVSHFQGFF